MFCLLPSALPYITKEMSHASDPDDLVDRDCLLLRLHDEAIMNTTHIRADPQ